MKRPTEQKLSARIEALLQGGISPEGLADRIGVSLPTIYRWRAGGVTHSRALLRQVERVEAEVVKAKA